MTTIWRILAFACLCIFAVHRYVALQRPPDVQAYQAAIRQSAGAIPNPIGPWVGQDVEVPAQALTVLRPNVMISRRYTNVETGATSGVLAVHCSNAHDMVGHFPKRCYPAAGWKLESSESRDWSVGDLQMHGMEYHFTRPPADIANTAAAMVVVNCLLRPSHRVLRDMSEMTESLVGAGGESSGSGQIQIYFDAAVPREKRDAAVVELMTGYRPFIDSVLADPQQQGHH